MMEVTGYNSDTNRVVLWLKVCYFSLNILFPWDPSGVGTIGFQLSWVSNHKTTIIAIKSHLKPMKMM